MLAAETADALLLDIHLPTMSGLAPSTWRSFIAWPALEGHIAIMTGDAEAHESAYLAGPSPLQTVISQTVQPPAGWRIGSHPRLQTRPRVGRDGRMTTVAQRRFRWHVLTGIPKPSRPGNLRDLSVVVGAVLRCVGGGRRSMRPRRAPRRASVRSAFYVDAGGS